MTWERPGGQGVPEPGNGSRDFDYGVGDDLRQAQQQVRTEIAARIRGAARLDPTESAREKRIYEIAAVIAEGHR